MSVIVTVIGANLNSEEYRCAQRLKEILDATLPKSAKGQITLHANAQILGQDVKDIDLIMLGTLQEYSEQLSFLDQNNERIHQPVQIRSFCTAIEIKGHDISGIVREGTEFYVRYGMSLHPVTTQSNKQKTALMNFFKDSIGFTPYITNLIWFTGITKNDLHNLLVLDNKEIISNAVSGEITLKEIFQILVSERQPASFVDRITHKKIYFIDLNNQISQQTIENVFSMFTKAKTCMGELTRKRIEQITSKSLASQISMSTDDDRITIIRGRAGTGKTVGIIQTAIRLVDEKCARVLILTYNRALVSDIRRLFALADLPDMFQSSCVTIDTMQSFFYKLIAKSLYHGQLNGEDFLRDYNVYLREFNEFLAMDEDAQQVLKELLGNDYYLNWDYCLIDEAQDWTSTERDLILSVFPINRVFVADGGLQYVRGVDSCDWSIIQNKNALKLKYCLRQKSNLVQFINAYLDKTGASSQRISTNETLKGGRILIHLGTEIDFLMLRSELKHLKEAGNSAYDMLCLVPYTMVGKEPRAFKLKAQFESNGIICWDGTNEEVRQSYPLMGDEIRVLQYESARGLEAWTTVCFEIDTFIEEKLLTFDSNDTSGSLLLESLEERKKKYLINWILIPLTRAIDTLIVTFRNPNSESCRLFKEVAREHLDYVQIR